MGAAGAAVVVPEDVLAGAAPNRLPGFKKLFAADAGAGAGVVEDDVDAVVVAAGLAPNKLPPPKRLGFGADASAEAAGVGAEVSAGFENRLEPPKRLLFGGSAEAVGAAGALPKREVGGAVAESPGGLDSPKRLGVAPDVDAGG